MLDSSQKFSLIDIETTGGSSGENKIIEIAIINLDGNQIVDQYTTLINPERTIPPFIQSLTGINDFMVKNAPKYYEIARKIVEMTEGRVFIAHNVYFDFNFIKHEFSQLGFQFNRELLCTVRLARKAFPGLKSYSLRNLCKHFKIEIVSAHRALDDAKATVTLFQKIQKCSLDLTQEVIKKRKLALPANLSQDDIEALPTTPGIYYFYDKNHNLLYVGKSKNIKQRVSNHFRPNMKKAKEIQLKNLISSIEYKVMGNELAALLYEAQEIKKLSPPYNVALKGSTFPFGLYLNQNENGLKNLKILRSNEPCLFRFRNKIRAKKKLDKIYESALGCSRDSLHFNQRQSDYISKLGIESFNRMLESVYFFKRPEKESFFLQLSGRKSSEKCFITVNQLHPTNIEFKDQNGDIEESLGLDEDQDLKTITLDYLLKKKVKMLDLPIESSIY
ncbi:exonuclease domain-containing protein [Bacteriovoracaceae bacterium]|nr:exonuclease domain-containing protein [Bacteriovoracaceae bacterium]